MSRLDDRLIRAARFAMADAASRRAAALLNDKPQAARTAARLQRGARRRYVEALRLADLAEA